MMALAWSLAYAGIIAMVGCACTWAILGRQRRSLPELIGLVLLLGAGLTGTLLFWLSLMGLRPTRGVLLALGLLAAAVLGWLWRVRWTPSASLPRLDRSMAQNLVILPGILGLSAANLLIAIPALGFSYFAWDAFVIWGFKARVLFHAPLTPMPHYFSDVTLSFSHLDYPLLLPMLVAGAYGAIGQVHEPLGKIILPILFAGQTLIAYVAARLWLGRAAALIVAVLLIGMPFSLRQGGLGNADSALTGFYLGSIFYLVRWARSRLRSDILLAAIFSVFMATTKSEGLPLAAINGLVLLAAVAGSRTRSAGAHLGLFLLVFLAGAGPWLIWRMGLPHTNDNYLEQLKWSILVEHRDRLGTILTAFGRQFVEIRLWGFLWLLVPLLAILGFGAFARRETRLLWALLIMHLALYCLVYLIAAWDVNELMAASLDRMLLHAAPAAMLIVAVHWSASEPILGRKR